MLEDRLVFTESTAFPLEEKKKDRLSKHYLISKFQSDVAYAGEMHIYQNPRNRELFLVFDNASGTYLPPSQYLPQLKQLLEYNFSGSCDGVYFVTKPHDQKVDTKKLFTHRN